MTFVLKCFAVLVNGFPNEQIFYARDAARARARAWESYRSYADIPFKRFLQISTIRRAEPPRADFGKKIMVADLPAYFVNSDGHYVWFVRPGKDQIMLSHPLDVKE
ncbi:hypothetical protein Pan1_91 [Pseudanabaena phage Pan1]|nr:hypothetical protein Pan1_91 [Pseudanabaena phage Pan1]